MEKTLEKQNSVVVEVDRFSHYQVVKIEKQSLLSFKQTLKDPSNLLSSWNNSSEVNCCKWKGVFCNNLTGHVHQLHLQSLSGKITPSLLNLKHLKSLDLSQNHFHQTMPAFIGSLTSLEYLNLSGAGFYGKIPHNIGNLSNLHTLVLEDIYYPGSLYVDSLEWLSGLSKLEHLNMNYVNLNKATNWAHVINKLPSLIELYLSSCSLNDNNDIANNITNSLAILDLSSNNFESLSITRWIFQLTNLIFLDLSYNSFEGPIPSITNTSCKLQHIDLSFNSFNSTIPDWLYTCKGLEFVDLSSLESLDMGSNKLTGNLPESMGQLSNLKQFYMSDNMLEGVVTETHFAHLSNLTALMASGNQMTLKVSPYWIPPFKLHRLRLGSWNFGSGSGIPTWLETQKRHIWELDLSSTLISGNVPSWVWNIRYLNLSHNQLHGKIPVINGPKDNYHIPEIYRDLSLVYLSSNKFSGSLPRIGNTVTELDLSNNSFSGGISHFLCDTTNQTYRLEILHLGGNHLTGELPEDCLMKWPSLKVLNLGNNNLSGRIPSSIGFLANLRSLNLYNNNFSGHIPFSMRNCTNLVKIDLADNNLDGNIPTWMGTSLSNLWILILRSNKLSGEITSTVCQLNSLQILDLSDNRFSGIIPRCVDNFTAMKTRKEDLSFDLQYSFYWFAFIESAPITTKGSVLAYDTILRLVTNIDLSNNNLSGDIPREITSLVELRSLNLSEII
ncbi:hypothetical protein DH2020_027978 [Rehmannia glutinosa]|uniref:Leucine-rich repeat-containing N-terminal plant-type domain-containing protein n=1 Tax=Rehmannia glutinosa TaxID=99300 RepID=A0ABR0VSQ7_REHGL